MDSQGLFRLPVTLAQDVPAANQSATPGAGNAAQTGTTGQDGAPKPTTGQPRSDPFGGILFFLLPIVVLMFVMSFTSTRKEKKKREKLLESMKKGSKIQTIGGIIGSVVEVRTTFVIVKVDESNNTRLRFDRSAIAKVLDEDTEEKKEEKKDDKKDDKKEDKKDEKKEDKADKSDDESVVKEK